MQQFMFKFIIKIGDWQMPPPARQQIFIILQVSAQIPSKVI